LSNEKYTPLLAVVRAFCVDLIMFVFNYFIAYKTKKILWGQGVPSSLKAICRLVHA